MVHEEIGIHEKDKFPVDRKGGPVSYNNAINRTGIPEKYELS